MDTVRQRDVGVGEKISKCEGGRDRERGERQRWITVWQVEWKSRRGCLKQCVRSVRCGVAQRNVWVIHHRNTAGGHSLAQRYAEQGRIMCCTCTRSIWLKHTAERATFTHPPHSHFINLLLACSYSLRHPPPSQKEKQEQKRDTSSPSCWGEGLLWCVPAGFMLL